MTAPRSRSSPSGRHSNSIPSSRPAGSKTELAGRRLSGSAIRLGFLAASVVQNRHARACRGHPRFPLPPKKDVDGRDKHGHDAMERNESERRKWLTGATSNHPLRDLHRVEGGAFEELVAADEEVE